MNASHFQMGAERLTPKTRDDAVSWWFYRSFDDGFGFARGGRSRTKRDARHLIDAARKEADREHGIWLGRPTHTFSDDFADLTPLDYGYTIARSPRFPREDTSPIKEKGSSE